MKPDGIGTEAPIGNVAVGVLNAAQGCVVDIYVPISY